MFLYGFIICNSICRRCRRKRVVQYFCDLKRAVEDVILRPDQNTLNELDKRDTIAALDLCQPEPSPPLPTCAPSAASMNACSCSSETVPVDMPRPPPPLCTSTSLDTIVNRPQPLLYRHSSGMSRRQSRVLMTLQSKRKRSNSLTNYQKTSGTSVSLPPSARQTPMRFGDDDVQRFRNTSTFFSVYRLLTSIMKTYGCQSSMLIEIVIQCARARFDRALDQPCHVSHNFADMRSLRSTKAGACMLGKLRNVLARVSQDTRENLLSKDSRPFLKKAKFSSSSRTHT
ncbi:unnamed protein product [Angiostrongylus costaricensis]|uniref:Uncharacterized protein n=1 Tax=Angiostrongylus costaricensis TaxID=334426 RepID=A0A3P7HA24_ANGCS|nr:unnamed protein product [Angiostrongylus costaricensis]